MSKNFKVELLGGNMPEELQEALQEKLAEVFGGGNHDEEGFKVATREQVQHLIEAASAPRFKIGDVVTLREQARDKFRWPSFGDKVIVTQTLETPVHAGDPGTSGFGRRYDIALAFMCPEGHVHEFMHDSRDFEIAGSTLN